MADDIGCDAFPWHLGVFDAHCHPTDTVQSLNLLQSMRAKVITIMATRAQDQLLVAQAAEKYGITGSEASNLQHDWSEGHKVVPAFGWHPWFSHQMFDEAEYEGATALTNGQKFVHYQTVLNPRSDDEQFLKSLPDPRPFGHFIQQTEDYLRRFSWALVGEVGLDRSFRIPGAWLPQQLDDRDDALTPGGREGRELSPYRVSIDHQKKVLLAQLRLAGKFQRAVSLHGVQAHGAVYDVLAESWKGYERYVPSRRERKKQQAATDLKAEPPADERDKRPMPFPPRVCLHSFSGPAEAVRRYVEPAVPCDVYFSFSTTINSWSESGEGKVEAAVKAVPDDRVLVESDLHTAGDRMDAYLEEGVRKICMVKMWTLEDGVRRLASNWKAFVFGLRDTDA